MSQPSARARVLYYLRRSMPARTLAGRNGARLVEATQGLPVPELAPGENMVAGQVGLDIVLYHGLVRSVATGEITSVSLIDCTRQPSGKAQRRALSTGRCHHAKHPCIA